MQDAHVTRDSQPVGSPWGGRRRYHPDLMSHGPGTRRRDVCSTCDSPAPKVQSAGTLGALGWRMRVVKPKSSGLQGTIEWVCPECWTRSTGSSPLGRGHTKE
jgi:hypothetical protein